MSSGLTTYAAQEQTLIRAIQAKHCSRCHKLKPVADFNVHTSNRCGYQGACRDCYRIDPKMILRSKRYYRDHSDRVYFKSLRRLYRVSRKQYLEMYNRQQGKCAVCSTFYARLCVDHNHVSQMIRALLCQSCNRGLGTFKDSSRLLRQAFRYLQQHGS